MVFRDRTECYRFFFGSWYDVGLKRSFVSNWRCRLLYYDLFLTLVYYETKKKLNWHKNANFTSKQWQIYPLHLYVWIKVFAPCECTIHVHSRKATSQVRAFSHLVTAASLLDILWMFLKQGSYVPEAHVKDGAMRQWRMFGTVLCTSDACFAMTEMECRPKRWSENCEAVQQFTASLHTERM